MIWQFGELGYDYTINSCEDGSVSDACRTSPKPVRWDYLNDPRRQKLFDVYSAMLRLRDQFGVFTSGKETLSLGSSVKTIQLSLNDHNITLIGNFDVVSKTISVAFQHTGTWYEFFSGASISLSEKSKTMTLQPGEYLLYSDKKLPDFGDLATLNKHQEAFGELLVYPNPANTTISLSAPEVLQEVCMYSIEGKLLKKYFVGSSQTDIDLSNLKSGIYLIIASTDNQHFRKKFVKD
jgi:hypothetical protein